MLYIGLLRFTFVRSPPFFFDLDALLSIWTIPGDVPFLLSFSLSDLTSFWGSCLVFLLSFHDTHEK